MHTRFVDIIIALMLLSIQSVTASCWNIGDANTRYCNADAVYIGQVDEVQDTGDFDLKYHLNVTRQWKGNLSETTTLLMDQYLTTSTILSKGERYIVFAHKDADGQYRTDRCSGTQSLMNAEADIAAHDDRTRRKSTPLNVSLWTRVRWVFTGIIPNEIITVETRDTLNSLTKCE